MHARSFDDQIFATLSWMITVRIFTHFLILSDNSISFSTKQFPLKSLDPEIWKNGNRYPFWKALFLTKPCMWVTLLVLYAAKENVSINKNDYWEFQWKTTKLYIIVDKVSSAMKLILETAVLRRNFASTLSFQLGTIPEVAWPVTPIFSPELTTAVAQPGRVFTLYPLSGAMNSAIRTFS